MSQHEGPWRGANLDPDHLWSGQRSPDAKQPTSHPWSYHRNVTARYGDWDRAVRKPGAVVNKPSPRRVKRSGRHRRDVGSPVGQAALNAEKESCPRGHSLVDAYEHFTPQGWRQRRCRTCALERQREKREALPPKPERVGPRGAAALALASPTCRKGHAWSPENTVIRGGEGKLSGTRLCRACREERKEAQRLERWRAGMNARLEEEHLRREAEERAFAERRLELARARQEEQLQERRRNEWVRGLLHRWSPDGEPSLEVVRDVQIRPRAVRFEQDP
jgi:hypothetical protein